MYRTQSTGMPPPVIAPPPIHPRRPPAVQLAPPPPLSQTFAPGPSHDQPRAPFPQPPFPQPSLPQPPFPQPQLPQPPFPQPQLPQPQRSQKTDASTFKRLKAMGLGLAARDMRAAPVPAGGTVNHKLVIFMDQTKIKQQQDMQTQSQAPAPPPPPPPLPLPLPQPPYQTSQAPYQPQPSNPVRQPQPQFQPPSQFQSPPQPQPPQFQPPQFQPPPQPTQNRPPFPQQTLPIGPPPLQQRVIPPLPRQPQSQPQSQLQLQPPQIAKPIIPVRNKRLEKLERRLLYQRYRKNLRRARYLGFKIRIKIHRSDDPETMRMAIREFERELHVAEGANDYGEYASKAAGALETLGIIPGAEGLKETVEQFCDQPFLERLYETLNPPPVHGPNDNGDDEPNPSGQGVVSMILNRLFKVGLVQAEKATQNSTQKVQTIGRAIRLVTTRRSKRVPSGYVSSSSGSSSSSFSSASSSDSSSSSTTKKKKHRHHKKETRKEKKKEKEKEKNRECTRDTAGDASDPLNTPAVKKKVAAAHDRLMEIMSSATPIPPLSPPSSPVPLSARPPSPPRPSPKALPPSRPSSRAPGPDTMPRPVPRSPAPSASAFRTVARTETPDSLDALGGIDDFAQPARLAHGQGRSASSLLSAIK